ncbi:MAG: CsiV family protein [Gammaproteobacteria bacterium]
MKARHGERRRFLQQSLLLGTAAGTGWLGGWDEAFAQAPATDATAPVVAGLAMELLLFRQGTLPPPPVDERNETTTAPTLVREQIVVTPPARLQLAGAAAALRKRADYGVLALGGWMMPVGTAASGTVSLGDALGFAGGSAPMLTGSVTLSRGTYLSLGLDLLWTPQPGYHLALSERRRVKFNERHYFDHESFGAIVLVRAPA